MSRDVEVLKRNGRAVVLRGGGPRIPRYVCRSVDACDLDAIQVSDESVVVLHLQYERFHVSWGDVSGKRNTHVKGLAAHHLRIDVESDQRFVS